MMFIIVIFLSSFALVDGAFCGEDGSCTCDGDVIRCERLVYFKESFRVGKTIILDLEPGTTDLRADLLVGYGVVKVLNKDQLICQTPAPALNVYLINCHDSEIIEKQTKIHVANTDNVVSDSANVNISTDKGRIVTMITMTLQLSFLTFIVYQILVSLLQIHLRINKLTFENIKAPCIIRAFVTYLAVCCCCVKCLCPCKPCQNLEAPNMQGINIK